MGMAFPMLYIKGELEWKITLLFYYLNTVYAVIFKGLIFCERQVCKGFRGLIFADHQVEYSVSLGNCFFFED